MRILVAEDEAVTRRLLASQLDRWGYRVQCVDNGTAAWELLARSDDVDLALLDWEMPGLDGTEVCRRLRDGDPGRRTYVLLCTARNALDDVVEGLECGADDYVKKPVDLAELRARVAVGARTVGLNQSLRLKIEQLSDALAHVRTLQGLLPICMHCRRIRNDGNVWQRIEAYIEDHTDVAFSHGLCDTCLERHYPAKSGASD